MLKDFNAVKITVASPQEIINWSFGEVTKAETINYRTFKPEPNGLMAEEIFGPVKDFECYCGKYKKVRYKGIVCDRCGVEVTHKRVRRERMGHLKLAAPTAHVWFSNGVPNRLALILDIPQKKLETVIYYARYVVTGVNAEEQEKALANIETLKAEELAALDKELQERVSEISSKFEAENEELRKKSKDEKKLSMQIERHKNTEKSEAAKIKSAYKQREESIHTKFDDLKVLIENVSQGYTLSEDDFQLLDEYDLNFFDAGMGAEALKMLLEKLDIEKEVELLEEVLKTSKSQLKKSRVIQRLRVLKGIKKSGIQPSWLILDVLPVIPPDLRPIIQLAGGRFATYDLNDLYRRVINRNNRLKRLIALGAPEIILRNEKRMLQEAVDSLLDNNHKPGAPALNTRGMPFKSLSDMLRGKYGRFRQNLLGKRVDYSGRAVIVSGPELDFNHCGIPKQVALELFKPFVIRELIARGIAANPTRAKAIFESEVDEVWDILEEVSKDRPVLLNRAPTLHRHSILAFYPVLIEGNAIRLHPMTCKGFNADFDGDQMAVHLPLSDEAVRQVKERMFVSKNILSLRDSLPIVNVEKDMTIGVYFLTHMRGDVKNIKKLYSNTEELLKEYSLSNVKFYEPVKLLVDGKIIVTTAGRIIFNQEALPADFRFVNETLKATDISSISAEIFRNYGADAAINSLDKIKNLGFKYATKMGFSIALNEFTFGAKDILETELPIFEKKIDELGDSYNEGFITKTELNRLEREEWEKSADKIQETVWNLAQENDTAVNFVDLNKSAAGPVSAWIKKIAGVRGYVSDIHGNKINFPLANNYERGLNNLEYFVAGKEVRKSMTDVGLKTSESGYLTRRLVDVAQDIITRLDDCGTSKGVPVNKTDARQQKYANRLTGRVTASDIVNAKGDVYVKANELISIEVAKQIEEDETIQTVVLRSPLTCQVSHGCCQKCYGNDNSTGKIVEIGEAVGIIAAQALGEPTTQLTLKSKSDARAAKSDVTKGFPRVEELFEARTPKALALMADFSGTVSIIDDKKEIILRITAKKKVAKKFKLEEGDELMVKNNKEIESGQVLIVKKDKSEIKVDMTGIVQVGANDEIQVIAEKEVEVEKNVLAMSDLMVKNGDYVEKGDQLTFGSIDPKEMSVLRGVEQAQKYIIDGIQEVYGIQGLEVDDRHLEIISRQMGRYGLVTESGDSDNLLPGDYADVLDIEEENRTILEGKKPIAYERIMLGITNSSIRTESFLSAASFEQQVRVLTDAALVGKIDYLRGLKENVIIGRPVPLGEELKRKLGLIAEASDALQAPKADEIIDVTI